MPDRHHKAFTVLVREHTSMLLTYLRAAVQDPGTVDDLFQETMVTAWRRFDDYDEERPFAAWLRGIARRLVLAHLRARANAPRGAEEELLEALEARMGRLDLVEADAWQTKVASIDRCLERLPAPMREAIDLHYREALGTAEIARRADSTVEAVKKRLQRARALLARCLGDGGPLHWGQGHWGQGGEDLGGRA